MNDALHSVDTVIWEIDTETSDIIDLDLNLLDPEEMVRFNRFKFEKDRRRFAKSHIACRKILAHYVGVEPSDIQYRSGAHGKPSLCLGPDTKIPQFNLSHSDKKALLVVDSRRPVGIDLEKISDAIDYTRLIRHVCTINEAARIGMLPVQNQSAEFLRYWTAKEAYLKGTGMGFSVEPRSIEIGLDSAEVTVASSAGEPSSWRLRHLSVAGGFMACLATFTEPTRIVQRNYIDVFSV